MSRQKLVEVLPAKGINDSLEAARAVPLPGVLDIGDVVVLELLVSSLKVVVGVVTVVLFVVIWVVEVSDMNENCCRWLD